MAALYDTCGEGKEVSPRGVPTKEILAHSATFDMKYPVCYHQDRKLNYSFMAAEAYWITSGSMFVEDIAPYNKHIAQFSDDNYIFNGAYGPRFIQQFEHVVNTLVTDSLSRQAVITIWTPNPIKTKDYPCTLNLQWLIRDGFLYCIVNMRSNDLWLGRPYDFFNFSMMSLRVLCAINERTGNDYSLGDLTINVGSLHYYLSNEEDVIKVLANEEDKKPKEIPPKCFNDWPFVVKSLLACRDKTETRFEEGLIWRIRP
jgi:thymidylate synthase